MVGSVIAALSGIVAIALTPGVVVAGAALVGIGYAIRSPSGRLAAVSVAPWFLLGTEGLSASDVVLMAIVFFSAVIATIHVLRSSPRKDSNRILLSIVGLLAMLSIGTLIGLSEERSIESMLRDASPYLLFAAAAPIAFDAARSLRVSRVEALLIITGLLSTAGSTVSLFTRRGLVSDDLPALLFQSGSLATALWVYSVVKLSTTGISTKWVAIGSLAIGIPLLTGTRTILIKALVPLLLIVYYLLRGRYTESKRATIAAGVLGITITAVFLGGLQTGLIRDADRVVDRLGTTIVAVREFGADASLTDRLRAHQVAWDAFSSAPAFGVGLAPRFEWPRVFGPPSEGYTLDAASVTLAKFGVLGLAVSLFTLRVWLLTPSRSQSFKDALIVFIIISAPAALGFPIEDKGFVLGAMLLMSGSRVPVVRRRHHGVKTVDASLSTKQLA